MKSIEKHSCINNTSRQGNQDVWVEKQLDHFVCVEEARHSTHWWVIVGWGTEESVGGLTVEDVIVRVLEGEGMGQERLVELQVEGNQRGQ